MSVIGLKRNVAHLPPGLQSIMTRVILFAVQMVAGKYAGHAKIKAKVAVYAQSITTGLRMAQSGYC